LGIFCRRATTTAAAKNKYAPIQPAQQLSTRYQFRAFRLLAISFLLFHESARGAVFSKLAASGSQQFFFSSLPLAIFTDALFCCLEITGFPDCLMTTMMRVGFPERHIHLIT
jgi:hypothetical protein